VTEDLHPRYPQDDLSDSDDALLDLQPLPPRASIYTPAEQATRLARAASPSPPTNAGLPSQASGSRLLPRHGEPVVAESPSGFPVFPPRSLDFANSYAMPHSVVLSPPPYRAANDLPLPLNSHYATLPPMPAHIWQAPQQPLGRESNQVRSEQPQGELEEVRTGRDVPDLLSQLQQRQQQEHQRSQRRWNDNDNH
jgi:hypothetical protein